MNSFALQPVHIVVIGGLSQEVFSLARDAGLLSALELLAEEGSVHLHCVASFPSVSPTTLATLITGLDPMAHGVLGHAWAPHSSAAVREFDPFARKTTFTRQPLINRLRCSGRRIVTVNVPRACGGTGFGVGANDQEATDLTLAAMRSGLGDMYVTYLRDLDESGHSLGPWEAVDTIVRVDMQIERLLNAYGQCTQAVRKARWIVVGDHGMSLLDAGQTREQTDLTAVLSRERDIRIVENGRSAFLYVGPNRRHKIVDFARQLSERPAIEQVFLREGGWNLALRLGASLAWRPGGDLMDARGELWALQGSPGVLDLRVVDNHLHDGEFPDALKRVADLINAKEAPDLVVTAKKGVAFRAEGAGRGNHGSLDRGDSLVPLLTVGFDVVLDLPQATDVALLAGSALRMAA